MRRADRIGAVFFLLFGAGYVAIALKSYTYWGANGPGSGFFPVWLGLAMMVLAALFLVESLRRAEPGPAWLPRGYGAVRLVVVIVASVLFIALLPVLGMTLGTALFLFGVLRFLEGHGWLIAVGVSVATAGFNWAVFAWWLGVPFPVGVLGF